MPRITLRGNEFSQNITEGAAHYPKGVPLNNIQAQNIGDALLRHLGSSRFTSELVKILGTYYPYKRMLVTSQVSEGEYINMLEGKTSQAGDQGKINKPFYQKRDLVLLAMKGADKERIELPCGEGRCEFQYPSEEDQVSSLVSPENQKGARAMLQRVRQVFSNKPG